jgi:GT2 family glycosyltransferase
MQAADLDELVVSTADGDPHAAASADLGAVVIGRNEGERLRACLKSLAIKSSQVVYVDSGSSDDSVRFARRLGVHVIELDPGQKFTAARARNEGAKRLLALYPNLSFLQFIDGDCALCVDWLATASDFMERHDDVAIVCGRRRERHPDASVYNSLCDREWDTPVGQALACGGDSLVRAAAFQAVSGFRADLIAGEEPELCVRLRAKGFLIWRLDSEMTLHDAAMTRFAHWRRRSARGGYAMAEVAALHWGAPTAIWRKELLRALFWGALAPALILLAALITPLALVGLAIYPLQIARIALTRRPTSWVYAWFVTLAKFAEAQGAILYYWRALNGREGTLIEYK